MDDFVPLILYTVLALPILASHFYSGTKDIIWLFLALGSLGLALFLIRQLSIKVTLLWLRWLLFSIACLGVAAFQLARLTSFYFQGESFNTRFFFHFGVNSFSAAWEAYTLLAAISLVFFVLIFTLAYFTILRSTEPKQKITNTKPRITILISGFILLALIEPDVLSYSHFKYKQYKGTAPVLLDAPTLAGMGLNENIIVQPDQIIKPGKNLVMIYLESLEAIYLNEDLFEGLTPNFTAWQESTLNFTDMHQTPGTEFTMGGIASSQCGTPLLFEIDVNSNDIMHNGLLNSMPCMSDILNTAGYRQVFLGGASTLFAGKGRFLRDHQYDEVLGKEELIPLLSEPGFYEGWGLYDESLFEIATDKYLELADKGTPFNLTILTLDTHHPVGRPSPSCPQYTKIDNSILHAVHCTDFLVKKFIETIKGHPAYQDTLVVFFSDHYAMRNDAQKYYAKGGGRRLFFSVLNGDKTGEIDSYGIHMDLAPTILSLLKIEHGAEFLSGQNLLASIAPARSENEVLWAPERLDAIRYINSNLFTSQSLRLCQSDELVQRKGNQIKLAGKTIVLSAFGKLLPDNALATSHAFLSFWDSAGFVNNSLVLKSASVAERLSKNHLSNFLLITRPSSLPDFLKNNIENLQAEVVALIGNLNGEVIELQLKNPGGDFISQTPNCATLLSRIEASKNLNDETIWKKSNQQIQEENILPPTLSNTSNIKFNGNIDHFLPKGFWAAESFGRWTSSLESTLTFIAGDDFCKSAYLALKISNFYEGVDPESLKVYLNNQLLMAITLDSSESAMHYFDCSSIKPTPETVIILKMEINKVVSPLSLGNSADRRTLGFTMINLAFVEKN